MKPTLPQTPDLDVSPIPRLPDLTAFVASLAHLGLGEWKDYGGLYRLALYRPSGVRVVVRGELTRLEGRWVMDVELRVIAFAATAFTLFFVLMPAPLIEAASAAAAALVN